MTYQEWQRGLIALGYNLGPAGADGIPGRMSQAATRKFKVANGMSDTPTVGPNSIAAMNSRLAQIGRAAPEGSRPNTAPAPLWVVEAGRRLGVAEVAGARSNPTILGWAKRLGTRVLGMNFTNDDTPWCGLFIAYVIAVCLPSESLPAIVVRASSWDKFGRGLTKPGYGCIVRYQRPGGGHVGILIGISADGRLHRVRGGNQSNRVSDTWIEASRCVAYRWPATINSHPGPVPILDAKGAPISRDER